MIPLCGRSFTCAKFQLLNLWTEVEVVAVEGLLPSLPMFQAEISKIYLDIKSLPAHSIQQPFFPFSPRMCATAIHHEALTRTTLWRTEFLLRKTMVETLVERLNPLNDHRKGEKCNLDWTRRICSGRPCHPPEDKNHDEKCGKIKPYLKIGGGCRAKSKDSNAFSLSKMIMDCKRRWECWDWVGDGYHSLESASSSWRFEQESGTRVHLTLNRMKWYVCMIIHEIARPFWMLIST